MRRVYVKQHIVTMVIHKQVVSNTYQDFPRKYHELTSKARGRKEGVRIGWVGRSVGGGGALFRANDKTI
jgi:uncharacterized membrane protein